MATYLCVHFEVHVLISDFFRRLMEIIIKLICIELTRHLRKLSLIFLFIAWR
jgi:hypothetical protein